MTNRQRSVAAVLVSLLCHAAVVAFVVHTDKPKLFRAMPEVLASAEVVPDVSTSVQEKTVPASVAVEPQDFINTFLTMLRLVEKESVIVYYEGEHVQGAMLLDRAEATEKSLRRSNDAEEVHVEVFDSGHPLHARLKRLIERGAHDEKIEAVIAAFKKSPTFDTRYTTRASLEK